MKIKRNVEKKTPVPVCKLNTGCTFFCEGDLHLKVFPSDGMADQFTDRNYTLVVNLTENMLNVIRDDVEVFPVWSEIITE